MKKIILFIYLLCTTLLISGCYPTDFFSYSFNEDKNFVSSQKASQAMNQLKSNLIKNLGSEFVNQYIIIDYYPNKIKDMEDTIFVHYYIFSPKPKEGETYYPLNQSLFYYELFYNTTKSEFDSLKNLPKLNPHDNQKIKITKSQAQKILKVKEQTNDWYQSEPEFGFIKGANRFGWHYNYKIIDAETGETIPSNKIQSITNSFGMTIPDEVSLIELRPQTSLDLLKYALQDVCKDSSFRKVGKFTCSSADYTIKDRQYQPSFFEDEEFEQFWNQEIKKGLISHLSIFYDYKIYKKNNGDWAGYSALVSVGEWVNPDQAWSDYIKKYPSKSRIFKRDLFYPNTLAFYDNLTDSPYVIYEDIYEIPPDILFQQIAWLSGNKLISVSWAPSFYGDASEKVPYQDEIFLKPLIRKYMEIYPATKNEIKSKLFTSK